jgi:16S rRNA U516 pseudouridylate synthase RsuA-like enzyme
MIRLNKFLATLGLFSRRKADETIAAGKVLLNGRVAQLGDKLDPDQDKLQVEGKQITTGSKPETFEYWLLNKPRQVVSTMHDEAGRNTVAD